MRNLLIDIQNIELNYQFQILLYASKRYRIMLAVKITLVLHPYTGIPSVSPNCFISPLTWYLSNQTLD